MVEKIKRETRRYAKRQITWFKKTEGVIWLNGQKEVNDNVNIIINDLEQ